MKNDKVTMLDIYQGIRKIWKINPKTRVHDKKKPSRNSKNAQFKKELTVEDYQ